MKCGAVTLSAAFLLAKAGYGDVVCPDSSYVQVDYGCTFTGEYRNGEAFDTVTISPDGKGESFAQNGIAIRVYLRDCKGNPVDGVPAESIKLESEGLCICPGGNFADAPTGELGMTTFSRKLRAGGWVHELVLQVDGVDIASVPVRTNSPDDNYAWPCHTSIDETARFNSLLQSPPVPPGPFDFNEDGITDLLDFAIYTTTYQNGYCGTPSVEPPSTPLQEGPPEFTPRIGVFFDPEGKTCSRELQANEQVIVWIIAIVDDPEGLPIVAAEFELHGYYGPVRALENGKRLTFLRDGHTGVVIGFDSPQTDRLVTLCSFIYTAPPEPTTTRFLIDAPAKPTNPAFSTPVLIVPTTPTTCPEAPAFQVIPAIGLEAIVNGECTVSVEAAAWQQVKELYRD